MPPFICGDDLNHRLSARTHNSDVIHEQVALVRGPRASNQPGRAKFSLVTFSSSAVYTPFCALVEESAPDLSRSISREPMRSYSFAQTAPALLTALWKAPTCV